MVRERIPVIEGDSAGSIHAEHKPELCPDGIHRGHWRTIRCDGETDTVECTKCGQQKEARCNFDEDTA